MRRRVLKSLFGLSILGLLSAAYLYSPTPILKLSSPYAFEVIERRYIDLERVSQIDETRDEYGSFKAAIMRNEPYLRSRLQAAQMIGMVFSLVVTVVCFVLAYCVRDLGAGAPRTDKEVG